MSDKNLLDKEEQELFDQLSAALVSYWECQTIYAGVKLGIFETISKDGLEINELSQKCEIDLEGAKRLVRALCALNLLEWKDGKILITQKGKFLQKSHSFSLAAAALMWGEEHYEIWSKTFQAVKEGKEMFSKFYGKTFFQWIDTNPKKAAAYQQAIETYAKRDYQLITDIYDFSHHKCIMDVGGGTGILLSFLLDKYPNLKGVLFEQKKSIEIAKKSILKLKVDRCKFIVGDFLKQIPKESDGIFLSRILHDWDDEKVNIILGNCNRALDVGQKLYIIELLLPEDLNNPFGGLLSLNMLTLTGGKERTLNEYMDLLKKNGFKFENMKELDSVSNLIITHKDREV